MPSAMDTEKDSDIRQACIVSPVVVITYPIVIFTLPDMLLG